jgi:hypothetical protein
MSGGSRFTFLRGAFRNGVLWGAGFSVLGVATMAVLRLAGILHGPVSWVQGLGLAIRFGIVGVVAGVAFSSVIRLLYHGRRLADINWVRFGLTGGLVTGAFVPLFLQAMNLLSGDGLVPWRLVLDDGVWATVFGAVAAGGSMWLAQRAGALAAGRNQARLSGGEAVDRLVSAGEPDYPVPQRPPAVGAREDPLGAGYRAPPNEH